MKIRSLSYPHAEVQLLEAIDDSGFKLPSEVRKTAQRLLKASDWTIWNKTKYLVILLDGSSYKVSKEFNEFHVPVLFTETGEEIQIDDVQYYGEIE